MRRQRNADATRKRRVNARRYVSRRKAMSYHRGFSEKNRRLLCFSSEFDCREKKKKRKGRKKGRRKKEEEEPLEREEKEDERRIISIERNRWEDAKQTRFPEWQSSSFENPIFQDFGYTTAMTSKWISSSMTHAILINFSSNRRAIPNTKIISGQMFFPVKNFHDRCVRDVVGLQFKNSRDIYRLSPYPPTHFSIDIQ